MKRHLTMDKPSDTENEVMVALIEETIKYNKLIPGKKGKVEALESFLGKYQEAYSVAQ